MRRLLMMAGMGLVAAAGVAGCSASADTGELQQACEKSYAQESEPRPEKSAFIEECVQKLSEMDI